MLLLNKPDQDSGLFSSRQTRLRKSRKCYAKTTSGTISVEFTLKTRMADFRSL
jgi:hypothetical protein